ncbi:ABC transporter permease [Lachnospiraceae bacterium LCP25S3_G4]
MIYKSWISFCQMITQIRRDFMLLMLCVAPILAGVAFRFLIPEVEHLLCSYFGKDQIIEPFYYIFDWMLAMFPGTMYAFTGALVALGEIDDKIAGYMAVTPEGVDGYLMARFGYPTIISGVMSMITLSVFGLTDIDTLSFGALVISSALMGATTAMLVVAVSTNKVEGMAVGKLSGLILMGMYVPIILHTPVQYAFGVMPSFWIAKFLLSKEEVYLVGFVLVYVIWMWGLYQRFKKRVIF